MKKNFRMFILAIIMIPALLLVACEDRAAIIEAMQIEIDVLIKENIDLKSELDEIKNGASYLIIAARKSFEQQDYDNTINIAKQLHDKYNGTHEDIEAQQLYEKVQMKIEEDNRIKQEEIERINQKSKQSKQVELQNIIMILHCYPSTPDSAGGVDLDIKWENRSEKEIKYIYFDVQPYNGVSDIVKCEIRKNSLVTVEETGPYKKTREGGSINSKWETVWYNDTIKAVALLRVKIVYMDNSETTIATEDIRYIADWSEWSK